MHLHWSEEGAGPETRLEGQRGVFHQGTVLVLKSSPQLSDAQLGSVILKEVFITCSPKKRGSTSKGTKAHRAQKCI